MLAQGRYSDCYGNGQFPEFTSDLAQPYLDGKVVNACGHSKRVFGQIEQIAIVKVGGCHGTPQRSENDYTNHWVRVLI